jgi:hypothetical protein
MKVIDAIQFSPTGNYDRPLQDIHIKSISLIN